jgi:hypothetical protein
VPLLFIPLIPILPEKQDSAGVVDTLEARVGDRFLRLYFYKNPIHLREWFMQNTLSSFFNAKGVALVGASASSNKLSHGILRNLMQYGYQGQIYPVNPRADEILGLRSYPDIASVPDPVDLAVIVFPPMRCTSGD